MANLQSCVDYTLEPSGMVTVSGFTVGTMSNTGASVTRKLLVALESIMAQSFTSTWLKAMLHRRFCTNV